MRVTKILVLFGCLSIVAPLAAQTAWPPAPFILNMVYAPNETLFRMDNVGGCTGNGVERSKLRLQWQRSVWKAPYQDRNDTTDTIRYDVIFRIDSVGTGTSKVLEVSFPSDFAGIDWAIMIPGDVVWARIFRGPVPIPAEPDTIVMRVNWYVRAVGKHGITYSDTAGVTRRQTPLPAPPLVLSYNRPPKQPPQPVIPLHNAVIKDITSKTQGVDVIWTQSIDQNINAGNRIKAFMTYDAVTQSWVEFPGRTVDTLTYQFVGMVARTAPAGKGAPVGSMIVRNTGVACGLQFTQQDLDGLFGGLVNAPTPTTADTVVIDWWVYVKDYLYHYEDPWSWMEEVTFRYKPDGTLVTDTAKWSRFGCRPHELVSGPFRFTLVRGTTTGIGDAPFSVAAVCTLDRCHPNPSTGATVIDWSLTRDAAVRIDVWDVRGAHVATLHDGPAMRGAHAVVWNGMDAKGRPVPAGTYYVRLDGGGVQQQRAIVMVR